MVKYSIHELRPNIFAVLVPNDDERSLLFLRVSEFYESTNSRFRRNNFDIKDFNEVYPIERYIKDWAGFNIPYIIAEMCYTKLKYNPEMYTMYDILFEQILDEITKLKSEGPAIIIGSDYLNSQTTRHELYHALFYLNKSYRNSMISVNESLPVEIKQQLHSNLRKLGYIVKINDPYVMNDEMQAYILSYDYSNPDFLRGIPINTMKKIHLMYKNVLESML